MVIAIAGVVHDHAKVRITNIKHWPVVVADEFKHELKIPHVIILNDFEANGYGVQILGPDDYIQITDNKPVKYGNIGVVGAGTGLGEAYLSHKHGTEFYNVHPSEGGHTEFCAMTLLDFEFREFVKKIVKETEGRDLKRISTERVVSGPALKYTYQFFQEKFPFLDNNLPEEICGRTHGIIEYAINKKDPICEMSLQFFLRHYG